MHAVSHGRIGDGQAHWSIAVSAIIGVQQKINDIFKTGGRCDN